MPTYCVRARAVFRSSCIAALAAFGLAACGGSGGAAPPSSAVPAADSGTLLLGITDADGDFAGYTVDVLSVTLERRGGGLVEVLPAATRIDFAQLTELADLLAVTTLAPGDFVGGSIRLDYRNAEVFVERAGQVVRADVVDPRGAPLGVTELDIELAAREHLVVTRGRTAFLSLDFDLAASHVVDLAPSPPVVTARPYVVAEIEPVAEKELRLRGALVSTDVGGSSYTVDVRPWFRRDGAHGRVTIHTTSSTAFEIDGVPAMGAAGLAALATKPAGTMTVAFGTLSRQDRRFSAATVHAGDSVSGERLDALHGNIVARRGDQLTVKGAFAVRSDHEARLHGTVTVQVGANTSVLKTGSPSTVLDASALSVGQHIVAFGALTEPATDAAIATLDATGGRIRMLPTHLHGTVVTVAAGQLSVRLRGIDRLGVEAFDFAGTGTTPARDAVAAEYEIGTGTLSLSGIEAGEAVRVVGFVQPFGSAPADFDARTVVDHRGLRALLGIGWGAAGTTAPFVSMGASGLVLDVDDPTIGARHTLLAGMREIDLRSLQTPPTLAPPSSGRAIYGISIGADIRLFASFAELASELAVLLGEGHAALALTASGSWDEASATLRATHVSVHLAPL